MELLRNTVVFTEVCLLYTSITDTPTENHPIVLVVEDNADIREYIRSSFTDIYEVCLLYTSNNRHDGMFL